ncbi:hypothetical protein E4U42_006861 [Claviceps africana]|uniref:FAD-binding domain-containing protein n=1 Tax=Claviceps africana TaxID=83212 RepID=A0A8K0JDF8_9HYPO|nr:hypothetical protein E4U42_006861 [Claviceps africana]
MMEVVIIGAGISGLVLSITLSRYRNVKITVFEQAAALENVGNGLQIPCNAVHTMRCLGMLDKLRAHVQHAATSFKSLAYADGKELLDRNLHVYEELYGAPWLVMHRADYMRLLLDEARQAGVIVKSGCEVRQVDFSAPSVTLASGDIHKADVVVGSDGVHSRTRSLMHPSVRAIPTGEYAYRALFERRQISSSPSLQRIASNCGVLRMWLGPEVNAVLYPLQDGNTVNLVIAIYDTAFNASCGRHEESVLDAVTDRLRGWDPLLLEILGEADQLVRYPLYHLQALPSWSRGSVTLVGDAAHAMAPHLGQGAAASVEDGFVLGTLLGRWAQHHMENNPPSRQQQIQALLRSYENVQRERTTRIASHSRWTATLDHLPPGPDQRARDAEFAAYTRDDPDACVSAMPWIDAKWNRELLGRKVDEETDREFQRFLHRRQCDAPPCTGRGGEK